MNGQNAIDFFKIAFESKISALGDAAEENAG
jgi:hypothetical protein